MFSREQTDLELRRRAITATTSPPSTVERFYLLDIMRGLASLAIVVWHYQNFFFLSPGALAPGFERSTQPFYGILALGYEQGWRAVQVFFVLSGFVFFHQYSEAIRKGAVGAGRFFVYRFSRLYPLHFATLLFVAAGQFISRLVDGQDIVYPCNDWPHFALNLLFAVDWMPGRWRCNSFNAPVWSVSIEILLYITFFAFAHMLPRPWIGQFVMTMVAVLAGIVIAVFGTQHLGEPIFCFYAGCLTALLWWRFCSGDRTVSVVVALLAGLVIALVCVAVPEPHAIILGVVAYPSAVLLLAALQEVCPRGGRSMRLIGDITYSTYLLHFPVQLTLILLVKSGLLVIDFTSPAAWLAFFALLLAVSIPTYYGFECSMQRWLRGRLLSHSGKSA